MYIIGLTGGIGSGKSTVATLFKKLGITVIDADSIAHQLTEPRQAGYQAILQRFGTYITQANKQLDRIKLRQLIFENPEERAWLESLLHPLIRAEMYQQALKAASPYCVMVIPLLSETSNLEHINRVLVVDVPESLQIERATQRDHCDEEQIKKIMATQSSREKRLSYADDVIQNDEDENRLLIEVHQLDALYRKLSE